MRTNAIKIRLSAICLLLLAFAVSGCSGFNFGGGSDNETTTAPVAEYYYGDFDDVPIPREMQPNKEGYVVYTQGHVKIGMQVFKGNVETASLNRAMVEYMTRDGWTLYSGSQGPKQTMLVFMKGDRLSVLVTIDGSLSTEMRVYVTQKI